MTLRVIAIDGPAASGKSSTAGLVARRPMAVEVGLLEDSLYPARTRRVATT